MNKWTADSLGFSVLRLPYLPENSTDVLVQTNQGERAIKGSLRALINLCQKPGVQQAISIASETLASNINSLTDDLSVDNLKLASSIYKYLTRMSTRATPFGAFSGVMTVNNSKETQMEFSAEQLMYVRIDNNCVMELARRIESHAIQTKNTQLLLRKNSSLFKLADELRYVSKNSRQSFNDYKLDSVESSAAIELVLSSARTWITIEDLVKFIGARYPESDHKQLIIFIYDLLKNQLLESNLTVVVSSKNSFKSLLERCEASQVDEQFIGPMVEILASLASVSSVQSTTTQKSLSAVKHKLKALLPDYEMKRWLHVDSFRESTDVTLGEDKTVPLLKTIQKMAPFFWKKNHALDEFTQHFIEHYGEAEVPLLEALDVDNGITFGETRTGRSPLLKGIVPEQNTRDFNTQWRPLDQYVMHRVLSAMAEQQEVIKISTDEIEKYQVFQPEPIASFDGSVSVHGVFLQDENNEPLYQIKSVSGPSSLSLLGRFCCGNEALYDACKEVAKQEQIHEPDAILAEIVHIQQATTANISGRPSLRTYEIVYGPGDSGLTEKHQISCDDLYLKVINDRLSLYSRKLGKEVKPRLASAHNTGGMNLPVYQFLHALQGKEGWISGLQLSQVFNTLSYLPEIRIDNLVVSERRWLLNRQEFKHLHQHQSIAAKLTAFRSMIQSKGISRYVTLTEGDNTLEFDTGQAFSALMLINELKNKKQATLTASLKGKSDNQIQHKGAVYRHEFVMPCRLRFGEVKKQTNFWQAGGMSAQNMKSMISLPGENWRSLKIYTGEASADKLMAEQLAPLANDMMRKNIIKQWFFIRYQDPRFHLRVRFKLTESFNDQSLNRILYQQLRPLFEQGVIKSIAEDSYFPEVARYGGVILLGICEQLFHLNSVIVADTIRTSSSSPDKDTKRWKMCLHLAWKLALSVSDSLEQMEHFYKRAAAAYDREYGNNQIIKKQLSNNYREAMPDVIECLQQDYYVSNDPYINDFILPVYQQTVQQLKDHCQRHQIPVFKIVQSLIHMDCNRMFVINQRANEWIIFHYLTRYTRTVIARKFKPGLDVAAGFV